MLVLTGERMTFFVHVRVQAYQERLAGLPGLWLTGHFHMQHDVTSPKYMELTSHCLGIVENLVFYFQDNQKKNSIMSSQYINYILVCRTLVSHHAFMTTNLPMSPPPYFPPGVSHQIATLDISVHLHIYVHIYVSVSLCWPGVIILDSGKLWSWYYDMEYFGAKIQRSLFTQLFC